MLESSETVKFRLFNRDFNSCNFLWNFGFKKFSSNADGSLVTGVKAKS